MTESAADVTSDTIATRLLEEFATREKQLIKDEEVAERNLSRAQERKAKAELELEIARARFERRSRQMEEAAAQLMERQASRAAGPFVAGSGSHVELATHN